MQTKLFLLGLLALLVFGGIKFFEHYTLDVGVVRRPIVEHSECPTCPGQCSRAPEQLEPEAQGERTFLGAPPLRRENYVLLVVGILGLIVEASLLKKVLTNDKLGDDAQLGWSLVLVAAMLGAIAMILIGGLWTP